MAGTAKQWLVGCGIGCGLMVALGLGLGAAGYYGVRHVAKRAETLEAASDSLATKYGPPEAWAPPLDGGLDPARIEAFLEARRLMAPERERTANNLAVLDGSKGSSVPAKIAAGVDFVPRLLGFIEERDRALLQVDMGPGEYMYIYSVDTSGAPRRTNHHSAKPPRASIASASATRKPARRWSAWGLSIDSTRVSGRGRRASGSGLATATRPERSGPPAVTTSMRGSEPPALRPRGESDSR